MVASPKVAAPIAAHRAAQARRRIGLRAQLDLVDEIGMAVATGRDLDSIIRLVGERVGALFHVRSVAMALYDEASGLISWPFELAEGEAPTVRTQPFLIGPGLTSEVIHSGQPLLMHDMAESSAHGAITVGDIETQSWLGVPMVAGQRVRGAIILESLSRNAFDEADLKLLSTLAASVGVAVENARLLGETRRLLGETQQRAAELSLINEIGAALAQQLDFQAIIELVGERVRALFATRSIAIALYEASTRAITWAYEVEEGGRIHSPDFTLGPGLTSKVIESRRWALAANRGQLLEMDALDLGGAVTESWLGVPVIAGERVIGVIVLESTQEGAFSESDARLLSTLASSMGVALQNARLFAETKRLLAVTDQRAAELALVNEIGQALAKQLDFDAIVELVGERIIAGDDVIGVVSLESMRSQAELLATIEHFAGDGLLVFFNDPQLVADHEQQAVRMAVAMRTRFETLQQRWRKRGYDLGFGVGVAVGHATLGRIGFEGRYDYGAIGMVVIMASRLGSEAAAGQILLSQRAFAAVEDVVVGEPSREVSLKGFSRPVPVHNVIGLREEATTTAN